ncbi:hypothetical protein RIF29_34614 [Crotalaria pallida]|uniref:PH domain-containing protein n=1 Tax=Crotalaria pallida TaxID=3830 RepID=A0AAN9E928_CROPI
MGKSVFSALTVKPKKLKEAQQTEHHYYTRVFGLRFFYYLRKGKERKVSSVHHHLFPKPKDKLSFTPIITLFFKIGLLKVNFMDDSPSKLKIIHDHFQVPASSIESPENRTPSNTESRTDQSSSSRSSRHLRTRRRLRKALMLNLFTLRGLPWGSNAGGQEKVELTAAELDSLRSELADIEEREAHSKAQLEHIDEVLRSARLSGYLSIRTRWAALPGEPPPIDDTEVDDWLPRFVVLHGTCIFLYYLCTDLSPQDSTLLSDIVEVGRLPSFKRDEDDIQYAFYILTQHGLRYECSSNSKIQVDAWLSALQTDCKLDSDASVRNGSIEM